MSVPMPMAVMMMTMTVAVVVLMTMPGFTASVRGSSHGRGGCG